MKYSIGNIVNSTVITMYSARRVLEISGRILCKVNDYLSTMLYIKHEYKIILNIN